MEIIKANAVKFEYAYPDEAPRVVLHGVDLGIEKGSFVALLGHNGSGKSTLAKHFNAILLPTGGTVLVDGMDTADEAHLYDVRRTVGMVLQNPDNQMVSSIVEEDVAFGPENLGVPPQEICRRVEDALPIATVRRTSSPAVRSSASRSRVFWRCSRRCWCSMSRPRCSIPSDGGRCSKRCIGSTVSAA